MKRSIGIHIRTHSFAQLVHEVTQLQLPVVQFFIPAMANSLDLAIQNQQSIEQLHLLCKQMFVHASYFINLANHGSSAHPLLWEELAFLYYCNITHYVIHPGVVAKTNNRIEALKQIAAMINVITKRYPKLTLLLENTAHGNRLVGGGFDELATLLDYCDSPDQVKICIDTAHAYAFGYDIATLDGFSTFIQTVEHTIGHERIGLLHLNDLAGVCASKQDHHVLPGTGTLGLALRHSVQLAQWQSVPIIIEAPQLAIEQQQAMLQLVHEWNTL